MLHPSKKQFHPPASRQKNKRRSSAKYRQGLDRAGAPFFGVMLGDGFVFWMGATYGRKLAKKGIFKKLLHEERMDYIRDQLILKHGNKIIFAARFMPGFRAPLFFTAGTLHVPFRVFLFYDGLAATLSVPLIVYAVYYFGGELEYVISKIKSIEQGIVAGIVLVVLMGIIKWVKSRKKVNQ